MLTIACLLLNSISYLEDAVNDTADVREGIHESSEASLAHSVEGLCDSLGLLLGSFQLLSAALLPLLQQGNTASMCNNKKEKPTP